MKLPNCENAVVDDNKLIAYSLDPKHHVGKHKARVFQSVLNINLDNFYILKEAILKAVLVENAVHSGKTEYGDLYSMDFECAYLQRTAIVRTGWIVKKEEGFPRLTTCFIIK